MFNTSVDAIMATFHRTIKDLNTHASKMQTKADAHRDSVNFHLEGARAKDTEATRALSIANKLTGIMN